MAPSPPTPEPGSSRDREEFLEMYGHRPAVEKLIRKIAVQPLSDRVFERTVADHLRVDPLAWRAWIEGGSQEDIAMETTRIRVPVQVVSGGKDPVFPARFLQHEMRKHFPGATFTEVPKVGHLLPLEAVETMAERVASRE